MRWVWLAAGLVASLGCSHPQVATPKQTISPVRSIAVEGFEGNGSAEFQKEVLKALQASGIRVKKRSEGVDAILTGVATDYRPNRTLMVVMGTTHVDVGEGQTAEFSNPVVASPATPAPAQNPGLGLNNPHMMMQIASVGMIVRLQEVQTGNLLWAYDYGYESMDVASALQTVASSMAQSLKTALPRLQSRGLKVKKG